MPTLIRRNGFEIRIYTFDHRPPHVHVFKAGAVMKIELSTCNVTRVVGGVSERDVRRAEQLVGDNQAALRRAWEQIHGEE